MRIDSNGRITTPYQPSFSAFVGCTTSSGAANLWSTLYSQGGLTWSGSSVTVPVAGVYLITWQQICESNVGRYDTSIQVNGSTVSSALNEANGDGYHQRTHAFTYKLSANDAISFTNTRWYNVGNTGGQWAIVSIALLG